MSITQAIGRKLASPCKENNANNLIDLHINLIEVHFVDLCPL